MNRFQVFEFKELNSTNLWLKEHLLELELPTLVLGEKQSAGKGRLDRKWISPKGGLYMSLGFSVEGPGGVYLQLMALIISQVFEDKHLKIKWPNDLFFHGKKVGGLLSEVVWKEEKQVMILGLGLNLTKITEVEEMGGGSLDVLMKPNELAKKLTERFLIAAQRLQREGFLPFWKEFEKKLMHKKGDVLTLLQGKKELVGTFLGLDSEGRLILETKTGTMSVEFGEVMHENKTSDS